MKSSKISVIKRIFGSKIFLVVSVIVLVFTGLGLVKVITQKMEVNREIKSLEDKIKNLEEQNLELTDFVDYLRTEAFEEEVARLQLGLKKPGEQVLAISSTNATSEVFFKEKGAVDDFDENDSRQLGNLYKWWQYFFAPEIK